MTRAKSHSVKPVKRPRRPTISDPTREKLLDVAGRIFAHRGFQATTIREISVAAGANVAAVNYHFGDKLGLYTEVVQHSARAAQLEAINNALDLNAPPEDILRAVIHARMRGLFRSDRPDWHFRILAHEMARPTSAIRSMVNKVGRPLFERMLHLIGGMLGLPADHDKTRLCAISVMGQMLAYVFAGPLLAGVWPELKMTPEQVDRIADHIADFSIASIHEFHSARVISTSKASARPVASRVRK
ncbi:MAG: CerR family C-terminal domain-containing protein [Acidobacteriota bacterium]|nr:CerR family C-terminal domain-containing protein [Acidobacteriota bacterium]